MLSPDEVYELGEQLAYHEAVLLRSTVSAKRLAASGSVSGMKCALDAHRRSMNEVVLLRFQMNTHYDGTDSAVSEACRHAMERVDSYVAPYLAMVMNP